MAQKTQPQPDDQQQQVEEVDALAAPTAPPDGIAVLTDALMRSFETLVEQRLQQAHWDIATVNGITMPCTKSNVSTFNPQDHVLEIKRNAYLPVKARVEWFRLDHPDWGLHAAVDPSLSDFDKGRAVVHAWIDRPVVDRDGTIRYLVVDEDWGTETATDWADFAEKAVTKAKGRVLASLGYGTLQCADFEYEQVSPKPYPGVDAAADRPAPKRPTLLDAAKEAGAKEVQRLARPSVLTPMTWLQLIQGYEIDGDGNVADLDISRFRDAWKDAGGTSEGLVRVFGKWSPAGVEQYLSGKGAKRLAVLLAEAA